MNITQLKRKFFKKFETEIKELHPNEGRITVRVQPRTSSLPQGMFTLINHLGPDYPISTCGNVFFSKYLAPMDPAHKVYIAKLKKYHPNVYKLLNYYGPLLPLHSDLSGMSSHRYAFDITVLNSGYYHHVIPSIQEFTTILEKRAESNFAIKNIDVGATMRLLDEYQSLYPNLLDLRNLE